MIAPVTALYGALLALLLLVLAGRVSLYRSRLGIGMGHGSDTHLARAIRAHGNAVEWILPMLVLMLVSEVDGANRLFLHGCGVIFLIARVAHATAVSRTSKGSSARFWGMAGTWLVIAALAVWDLLAFLRAGLRLPF